MLSALRSRLLELLTNPATGRLSRQKVWVNVAMLAGTVAFLRATWDTPVTPELLLAYMATVAGYGVASKSQAMKEHEKGQPEGE